LTVAASLAQIGEFSFILAALGVSLKLLTVEGQSLVLAGALVSIAINPLVFTLVEPAQRWIRARSALARKLEARDDPLAELPASTEQKYLARQVVLVGYGRVGRHIASALGESEIPYVVVDQNRERVEELRQQGRPAVTGDAVEPAVLIQAHIARAHLLVIATSDSVGVRQMIENARALNPSIQALVRCHTAEEAELLEHEIGAQVFLGEQELANAMARQALSAAQAPHGAPSASARA